MQRGKIKTREAQQTISCTSHIRLNVAYSFCLRERKRKYLTFQDGSQHCKEISIYVFPDKELRGLRPNFHIHVSVSDLYYIPTICPPIFMQQNMQTYRENI